MKKKTLAIILIVLLCLTAVYFATSFVVAQLAAPTAGALLDVHTFFVDQWAFIIENIVALAVLAVFLVLIVILALMYLFPKGRSNTSGKSYKKPRSRKASK